MELGRCIRLQVLKTPELFPPVDERLEGAFEFESVKLGGNTLIPLENYTQNFLDVRTLDNEGVELDCKILVNTASNRGFEARR